MSNHFLSTSELAKMLGISRVAVFQKIKAGQIKAVKVGRNYLIDVKDVFDILDGELSPDRKKEIESAVRRVITEYGETLRLLAKE